VHAWTSSDTAPRLTEKVRAPGDADPKALACYGLLVRAHASLPEQLWLRFAVGHGQCAHDSVSSLVRLPFGARGVRALLLVWDNTSWHTSQMVRTWLRTHNRQVKRLGCGVRILPCRLPSKSPRLNPSEPKWAHRKRAVMEPTRLLPAQGLADRVRAYYGCAHGAHLSVPEKAA